MGCGASLGRANQSALARREDAKEDKNGGANVQGKPIVPATSIVPAPADYGPPAQGKKQGALARLPVAFFFRPTFAPRYIQSLFFRFFSRAIYANIA
jgi:hypothetical protein